MLGSNALDKEPNHNTPQLPFSFASFRLFFLNSKQLVSGLVVDIPEPSVDMGNVKSSPSPPSPHATTDLESRGYEITFILKISYTKAPGFELKLIAVYTV